MRDCIAQAETGGPLGSPVFLASSAAWSRASSACCADGGYHMPDLILGGESMPLILSLMPTSVVLGVCLYGL